MKRRFALAPIVSILLLAPWIVSQEKSKQEQAGDKIDKKVVEIVKQVGELYKDAKIWHAEASIVTKSAEQGDGQTVKVSAVFDLERPNRLAIRTQMDGDANKGPDVVADGKNLIIHRKAMGKYSETESPQGLPDIGLGLLQLGASSVGMLFANLLADDPADLLMQGVNSCSYVGKDKIDGTAVHRMKFSQNEFDWELWVAAEGKPYVLRMVSMREGPDGKSTTTETYKSWKFEEAPAKGTFEFKAPKDATKVKDFRDQ